MKQVVQDFVLTLDSQGEQFVVLPENVLHYQFEEMMCVDDAPHVSFEVACGVLRFEIRVTTFDAA